jgi:DNA polymerase-3 subunit delta
MLGPELARLSSQGIEGIPLIRAVLKRMILLARLRAEVDRGSGVDAVMASQGKSLFWKKSPLSVSNSAAGARSFWPKASPA